MTYLTKDELRRLFQVVHDRNRLHHLFFLVVLCHGLRVSEGINVSDTSIADRQLAMKRLKKSRATLQPIHQDDDAIFDCTPLLEMAVNNKGRLFNFSRQYADRLIKRYCAIAGIHPMKAHCHSLKHSMAILIWEATHSLGQIQSYLGHKEASSTMQYLVEIDQLKAQNAVAEISI